MKKRRRVNFISGIILSIKIGRRQRECSRITAAFNKARKQSDANDAEAKVKFVSARSALIAHLPQPLALGEKFFTEDLLISSNFSDQLRVEPTPLLDARNNKHFYQILLIRDENEQGVASYKAVLVDTKDAEQLHKLFAEDRADAAQAASKRKMALYSPGVGIVDQGRNAFTNDELESPAVVALKAQTKVLTGQTKFDVNEKKYLNEKVKEIDNSQNSKIKDLGEKTFNTIVMHLNPLDQQDDATRFAHLLD